MKVINAEIAGGNLILTLSDGRKTGGGVHVVVPTDQRVKELIDEGYERLAREIGVLDDCGAGSCCGYQEEPTKSEPTRVPSSEDVKQALLKALGEAGFDTDSFKIYDVSDLQCEDENDDRYRTPTLLDAYSHATVEVCEHGGEWKTAILYFIEPPDLTEGEDTTFFVACLEGENRLGYWPNARVEVVR